MGFGEIMGGVGVMKSLFWMTKTLGKNFFRDRQSLFSSLAVPLVFLLIFGFMYAEQTTGPREPVLGVYADESFTDLDIINEVFQNNRGLRFAYYEEKGDIERSVVNRETSFGLVLEQTELTFLFNPILIQQNAHFEEMARGIKASFERAKAGVSDVIVIERSTLTLPGQEGFSPLEYILPGTIAIAVVSSGLFAITGVYLTFLEKGVLRRMAATPLRKEIFFLGLIFTRLVVAVFGAGLIILVGRIIFNFTPTINLTFFIPYVMVSTLLMMALGVLITLVFKKRENANQFAGFLVTVMIFFSGIYLPVEFLPDYLQQISRFLPLTHVASGLRGTMGIEPLVFSEYFLNIAGMLIISTFLLIFVAWRSKWGENRF